ncbi:MAG TPA: isoprenylcysteine carboxylmethyltransferase family protein [Anaerolineales bacterium]
MNTEPELSPPEDHPNVLAGILKRVGIVALFFVLIALALFLSAGRLDWSWAWLYLGICLVSVLINGAVMLRASPATIAERSRTGETEAWDRIIGGLWGVVIYFALPLVAGLDLRFVWTRDFSIPWNVSGAVVLAFGLGLTDWSMVANAFFSTAVRIQDDRGHTVCTTGPYRFVRHPGYVGFILQSVSVPFLLGSWWALIPGVMAMVLMIIRTSLEDRMLQAGLPGYQEYVLRTRYRLFPGIW